MINILINIINRIEIKNQDELWNLKIEEEAIVKSVNIGINR